MTPSLLQADRPSFARSNTFDQGPAAPITAHAVDVDSSYLDAVLELQDGSAFKGISFGAEARSVAGECVFQTGQS